MSDRRAGSAQAPLGVFDSGLGGLTVVRALQQALPGERIVYLGDTARVPYGTKGAATVIKYAMACARALVGEGVKALVVACNTVSAVAPERLRVELDIPVLGVIEPGARAAVAASRTGRIGVLATAGTIASGAYQRAVAQVSTRAEVIGQAAPLLVPLAEEGWTDGEVPRLAVQRYLEPLAQAGVDVIVLGCTHYPLLRAVIEAEARRRLGDHVVLVDSGRATAAEARDFLLARGLVRGPGEGGGGPESPRGEPPSRTPVRLLVTDVPRTFRETAARFLGDDLGEVEQIDL
jgi:glutamate racemase